MFDPRTLFVNAPRHRRLADGSWYRIRPSSARDRPLLVEFFERWSPDSRRMRFLAAKRNLTEGDLDFFTSADGFDHIALAAVRLDGLGNEVEPLGFARSIRCSTVPESAEMSVAVADDVQRQGVGSALLGQLTRSAQYAGTRHFVCEALADNPGMRALALQSGGSVRWHGCGTLEYEWPLAVDHSTDGLFWPANPQQELSESLNLWLTLIEQSVSIGVRYATLLIRPFSNAGLLPGHP